MKAPKLREELSRRGLATTGKKAELMERLAQFLEAGYHEEHVMLPSVKLTLDGDFNAVIASSDALAEFSSQFQLDLAEQLGISMDRIVITSVAEGSVIVYFRVTEPATGVVALPARQVYRKLELKTASAQLSTATMKTKEFDRAPVTANNLPTSISRQMEKLQETEQHEQDIMAQKEAEVVQEEAEEQQLLLEEKKRRRDELAAERQISSAHAAG
eukprot:SAG31_NODE_18198_length_643_cov_9.904412_1_plen_214_part_11